MKINAYDRIGLGPAPWDAEEILSWPTYGYDGQNAEWDEEGNVAPMGGHSREEWLELADEMIRRWTAWRAYVLALPDVTDVEEGR